MLRIEFCEPIHAPPFFAAISIAFLEPLQPEFQMQSLPLPGGVSDAIAKPLIKRVLNDAVFSVRWGTFVIRFSFVLAGCASIASHSTGLFCSVAWVQRATRGCVKR